MTEGLEYLRNVIMEYNLCLSAIVRQVSLASDLRQDTVPSQVILDEIMAMRKRVDALFKELDNSRSVQPSCAHESSESGQ
jgi:hypothetical protein